MDVDAVSSAGSANAADANLAADDASEAQFAAKFEEIMGSMLMLDLVFEHLAENE